MAGSKFEFYSYGIVAKDLDEDSQYAHITPIEGYPNINGDIAAVNTKTITSTDMNGGIDTSTINKSYTIIAKWLPISNPNRITPPMLCKGETVGIYKFGDSDKYFWVNLYNEVMLRKQEKVIYAFSNKASIDDTSTDQAYTISVDTINKHISIHTSKNDGEYTAYDIEINTGEGKIIIEDDKDNLIMLDSKKDSLTINTNKEINFNTVDMTNVIENDLVIKLKKLTISNGTNELISVLSELVSAMLLEQHTGNLGQPTTLTNLSTTRYQAIKEKIDSFKQ